jgi:hypothetical protein
MGKKKIILKLPVTDNWFKIKGSFSCYYLSPDIYTWTMTKTGRLNVVYDEVDD